MTDRPEANDNKIKPLLDLIERRFDIRLEAGSIDHLRYIEQHYNDKREMMLREHGEAAALALPDYAKAVLISEAARIMVLREIMPRPKKKKRDKDR